MYQLMSVQMLFQYTVLLKSTLEKAVQLFAACVKDQFHFGNHGDVVFMCEDYL